MRSTSAFGASVAALFLACAHAPPPVRAFSVGGDEIRYKDYSAAPGGACEGQAGWLAEELRAVNDGLAFALMDAQRRTLDEKRLSELEAVEKDELARFRRSLEVIRRCPGPFLTRLGGQPERAADLLDSLHEAIEGGRERLATAKVEQQWRETLRTRKQSAKEQWCAGEAVASPEVYYAFEQDGVVRFLFCNGAEVEQRADGSREVTAEPPPAARRRRGAPRPKYTEIVERFPSDDIDRAPATLTTDASVR